VLLLRQGIVLGGGNELVLGAFFSVWFSGIASGAFSGRRRTWGPGNFRTLAALLPSLLFMNALGVWLLAGWSSSPAGQLPSLGRGMLLAGALAFLPGMAIGIAFPAGAAAAGGIVRLFLFECLGSAAGGALATRLFLRFDPLGALAVGAVGGLLLLSGRVRWLALAAGAALWAAWNPLTSMRLGALHPVGKVVAEASSPYQHIVLSEYEGQRSLYLNGLAAGQSPDPAAAERLKIFERLEDGTGQTALLCSWPEMDDSGGGHRVLWMQADPMLARLRARTEDAAWTAEVEDPRILLGQQPARFSLILLDLPLPASVAQERMFTVEFFRVAARALRPGGILVLTLPASENYWGEETARLIGGLYRTLQAAFPDVLAAVGPLPCILASREPPALEGRLKDLRTGGEGAAFSALFPPERMEEFNRSLNAGPGRTNSDARPFAYLELLAVREKMDRLLPVAGTLAALSPWALLLLGLAVLPYQRRRRPLFQVFSTGVLGIGAFLLLSIRFQAAHGTYYGAVGLLTGFFMLGLAGSAPLAKGLAASSRAPWLPDAAALAFLGLVLAIPSGPGWLFAVFFTLAGTVTGLPFIFQGIRFGDDPAAAARMEFHDHLGAALGALATGLLLMPLLGMTGTVLALAGMKAVSLLLNLKTIPA